MSFEKNVLSSSNQIVGPRKPPSPALVSVLESAASLRLEATLVFETPQKF